MEECSLSTEFGHRVKLSCGHEFNVDVVAVVDEEALKRDGVIESRIGFSFQDTPAWREVLTGLIADAEEIDARAAGLFNMTIRERRGA